MAAKKVSGGREYDLVQGRVCLPLNLFIQHRDLPLESNSHLGCGWAHWDNVVVVHLVLLHCVVG